MHSLKPGYYLVTAGASGIGLAIATEIEQNGGTPVVIDLDVSGIRDRKEWIFYEGDVASPGLVDRIVTSLDQVGGSVEGLVNNAGIAGPTELLESMDLTEWERVLRVNVLGAVAASKSVIPIMKALGRGSIVSISSAATRNGFPLRAPYMTSKAALEALSETMAMELGPWGIRSNTVLPGIVSGPRVEAIISNQAQRRNMTVEATAREFVARTSMKTMVGPNDIARTVLFLLSPDSRFISGQRIGVCGNFEGYSSEMVAHLA